jgi:hypothetical protein
VNRAIELHDSKLASFELREGVAVVCLRPAYLHESEGRPGFEAGKVWTVDVDLRVFGASVPEIENTAGVASRYFGWELRNRRGASRRLEKGGFDVYVRPAAGEASGATGSG